MTAWLVAIADQCFIYPIQHVVCLGRKAANIALSLVVSLLWSSAMSTALNMCSGMVMVFYMKPVPVRPCHVLCTFADGGIVEHIMTA